MISQLLSTAMETEKYLRQNVVQVVPVRDDLYSEFEEEGVSVDVYPLDRLSLCRAENYQRHRSIRQPHSTHPTTTVTQTTSHSHKYITLETTH